MIRPFPARRSLVSPDSPDETRILAGCIQRRRHVHQPDTWGVGEQLRRLFGAEILSELCVDGERMPVKTGTRTQVAETRRSGMCKIFRDSLRNFCSSSVSPRAVLDERACLRKDVVSDRL